MDNNLNDINSEFSSDILVIGVNITDWFYTSKDISKSLFRFLKLHKKLSLEISKQENYIQTSW